MLRLCADASAMYSEWDVPKRSGKLRHVEHPKRPLKLVQARVARLLMRIAPPAFLMCPVRGRSFVDNARLHAKNEEVRSLDIRDYFPNTKSRRVFWFFRKRMECSEDVSGCLTALCTFKGHLATGSPVSPILSYFAHVDMWERIDAISRSADCSLSIYIDDLSLSGVRVPEHVFWKVKREIHRGGLRYHKEKRYVGDIKEITGVIVDAGILKAPHRAHRRLHEARLELSRASSEEERARAWARFRGQQGVIRQIAVDPGIST